jgi:Domain of unknown function (DUF4328)/Protein of unknown function (DUF2510)
MWGMSEHDGYPGAPPGWYPDPAGGPGQRWWDGYAWTDATVLPERPPPPPWATAPPPPPGQAQQVAQWAVASERLSTFTTSGLVEAEDRLSRVARVAVAVPAACSIANLIIDRVNSDRWLAVGHQLRVDWRDAQNNITPPPYHGPGAFTPASAFVSLAFVAAAIIALVWQHRAASAARALGFPSGQSPAWGVGSWFVPIVNLWIPYQAVRDCLPPGHPHRARVLRWWIAWLASNVVGIAVSISALFSSGTALVLSIPVVVADLAVIAWAPSIVIAIGASHREGMERQVQATGALQG